MSCGIFMYSSEVHKKYLGVFLCHVMAKDGCPKSTGVALFYSTPRHGHFTPLWHIDGMTRQSMKDSFQWEMFQSFPGIYCIYHIMITFSGFGWKHAKSVRKVLENLYSGSVIHFVNHITCFAARDGWKHNEITHFYMYVCVCAFYII